MIKSQFGAALTVILNLVLLAYIAYKSKIFLERSGVTIIEAEVRKHYTQEDKFTTEQGLMVAAGMALEVPPEVGQL